MPWYQFLIEGLAHHTGLRFLQYFEKECDSIYRVLGTAPNLEEVTLGDAVSLDRALECLSGNRSAVFSPNSS